MTILHSGWWMHLVVWSVQLILNLTSPLLAMFPFSSPFRPWTSSSTPAQEQCGPRRQTQFFQLLAWVDISVEVILRCNNKAQSKFRFHLCSSRMLCSIINNSLLKLRPTSTNFKSSPHPSSSSSHLQPPPPSEPPQQKVQPEVTTPNPLPFNPEEMVQKLRSDFKEEMENTLKKKTWHTSTSNPTNTTCSYHSATTTTSATWCSTTFQHSTISCPTSSLSLTNLPQGPPPGGQTTCLHSSQSTSSTCQVDSFHAESSTAFSFTTRTISQTIRSRTRTPTPPRRHDQREGWTSGQFDRWDPSDRYNDPQFHQVRLHAAQSTSKSKPVTAYSTEQSSYYPQHHSQGKKEATSHSL